MSDGNVLVPSNFNAHSSSRSQEMSKIESRDPYSVIIIGAGMAGLGAAKTLLDAGIPNIIILEGQDRAGGRVCSMPLDDTRQAFIELGAQWIHGENNPVYKLAKKENLLSSIISDEGLGSYVKPSGEEIPLAVVQEVAGIVGDILESCSEFIDNLNAPNSVGEFMLDRFTKYLDSCNDTPAVRKDKLDLFDWHLRFQMIDNSCAHVNCLSARAWGLYEYTGGTDYNNLRHGYCSLINCLEADLPSDSLQTHAEVTLVECSHDRGEIKVVCADGRVFLSHHVIVTSSLGYLKEHHQTMFSPSLPCDIVKAIDTLGFGLINKLFLVYKSAWWPDELKGVQLVWDCNEKEDCDHQSWLRDLTGFDVVSNLSGVLLGWAGGAGAFTMETLTDEEISQQCTKVLRMFLNRSDIPYPERIFRSSWQSNKFVRGGYSHTTAECDLKGCGPETLAQPVYLTTPSCIKKPAILLAGEAVHKSHFSTTHGAYLSGVKQANVIIDYLKPS